MSEITYAERVAKTALQFERGLLTQKEYEAEVISMAHGEINRLKAWKVVLAWGKRNSTPYIAYRDSVTEVDVIVDDHITAYELVVLHRIQLGGRSYLLSCLSEDNEQVTIVVERRNT